MKITKTLLDKLPPPSSGQAIYRDEQLKGFGVRITQSGVKSFVIEKRIHGILKRYTLGRYPAITVETARKQAQIELGKIAQGINPVLEKKVKHDHHISLQNAYSDYLTSRKTLKPKTKRDYDNVMANHLRIWLKKPLVTISRDMIAKQHTKIGKDSPATANLAMRLLRAIFNYAIANYDDACGKSIVTENPVKRLSQTRAWYRINRRDTLIKSHELKQWYASLQSLTEHRKDPTTTALLQDYLLLILFTGLRKQEASKLEWRYVDFVEGTFTIPDTKNNTKHILPMSDYLETLFKRRKQYANDSPFIFPAKSKSGHLEEPRKAMTKITKLSGIPFTVHDLRRTFITIAESLDIPVYALKRLLNHKMTTDVTAGYIIMDVERLREPMQKITDYILSLVGEKTTKILPLRFNQHHPKSHESIS